MTIPSIPQGRSRSCYSWQYAIVIWHHLLDFSDRAPILDAVSKATPVTDQELFDGIARKDNRAFHYLYQHHHRQIFSMVQQNSGNTDDAQDIFQEGLVALWTNIQTNRFELKDSARISTYLQTLCRNIWISRLRQKRPMQDMEGQAHLVADEDTGASLEQYEQTVALRRLLGQLKESCRNLLTLFYYQRLSLAVIAERLDITEKTAKNNKYRCMQRLRTLSKETSL